MNNLDLSLVGETAAVVTSCLWAGSSIFFTTAGKRIGSLSVNAYRTIIAVGFLAVAHLIVLGTVLPAASSGQWVWMGISGVVGLGVGDGGLFAAYLMIGPRRSLLVYASAPIFASVGAYLMLGEVLPTFAIIGIMITLLGIIIVILEGEERSGEAPVSKKQKNYGVLFAFVGSAGQGFGLVLAKKGIDLNSSTPLNPISATLMRLILGAIFICAVMICVGKFSELRKALWDKKGISNIAAGAFFGQFLGITLSMVAVTYTQTGVAQTLLSLMPVLIIPIVWICYRQRTGWQGILGAIIAMIGITVLFLV